MRAHAEVGIRYAREHPNWRQDQFAIDAIAKRVELVAEVASYRIPRSVWNEYPSIPWQQTTEWSRPPTPNLARSLSL
jgi:uncharacterized protein with HEPN domain